MQEETTPALNRRRLLRRAGTVAAGLGAAGVATAVNAAPAAAAGALGPTIITGSDTETALVVTNSQGPALQIAPSALANITATEAAGSVFLDGYGDVNTVGYVDGGSSGTKYVNLLYSPTWATMVVPIQSWRFFDSYYAVGSNSNPDFISRWVSGSIGSTGNVAASGGNDPSITLDLSEIFTDNNGVMAVQANLTVVGAAPGFGALWGQGSGWPGNSSINYVKGVGIANFTQTAIDSQRLLRVKVTGTARVIIDIVGFVVADYFSQFNSALINASQAKSAQGIKGLDKVRRPAPGR